MRFAASESVLRGVPTNVQRWFKLRCEPRPPKGNGVEIPQPWSLVVSGDAFASTGDRGVGPRESPLFSLTSFVPIWVGGVEFLRGAKLPHGSAKFRLIGWNEVRRRRALKIEWGRVSFGAPRPKRGRTGIRIRCSRLEASGVTR
jgi:hypothetical protein